MRRKSIDKLVKSSSHLKIHAQKALKAIDEYQKNRYRHSDKTISLLQLKGFQINSQLFNNQNSIKQFYAKEVLRVQLLPNSTMNFKIKIRPQIEPKIVIRNYRGSPSQINIGYNKFPKQSLGSTQKMMISAEVLLKLNKQRFYDSQWLYLTFKNEDSLVMFNFRMDEQSTKKRKKNLKTQKSQQSLLVIDQPLNTPNSEQLLPKTPKNRAKSLRVKSTPREESILMKPQQRKKKLGIQKYIQEQKIAQAKVRKQNTQILKVKQIELRQLGLKCKKMVEQYERVLIQQRSMASKIVQQINVFILLVKFCKTSNQMCSNRIDQSEKKFIIQYFADKFRRKMCKTLTANKLMIKDIQDRRKQQFNLNLTIQAYLINRNSCKKAQTYIEDAVSRCTVGLLLNGAMNQASKYRRYVRTLQRRWKSKYQSRTSMLMMYAQQQLKLILQNYPQLQQVEGQYRHGKIALKLCQQYQKDTANKVKQLFQAYEAKLQQIQQYKYINEQIKAHNAVSLKKKQKQLLQVPRVPARPQPRFFRDLLFLKSMIRGWLQVELRKNKKIYVKKQNKITSPEKKQSIKGISRNKKQ